MAYESLVEMLVRGSWRWMTSTAKERAIEWELVPKGYGRRTRRR